MKAPWTKFGGALLALTLGGPACGDDPPCAEVVATIADNHPSGAHVLAIPIADVTAAEAKTFDIQGNNTGHGHTVAVGVDDFTTLADGGTVALVSSNNGSAGMSHTHAVTLRCE